MSRNGNELKELFHLTSICGCASCVHKILTSVMINIVFDKSTEHAKSLLTR